MKKGLLILAVLFGLFSNSSNAQQTQVCYNGSYQCSLTAPNLSYSYKWEKKIGLSFQYSTVVDWGSSTTYTENAITAMTNIRCLCDTNLDGVSDSIAFQVSLTAYPRLAAGTITPNMSVCPGSVPNVLSMLSDATGGYGSFSHQWQESLDGDTFFDIVGATGTSYAPISAITGPHYYRLAFTNTCGTVYSTATSVSIFPSVSATMQSYGHSICYSGSTSLVVSATGGDGTYYYQWQESDAQTSSPVFVDVPMATSATFNPSGLTSSKYYRAIVSSGVGCGRDTTDYVIVNVYPEFQPGTVSGGSSICYNTIPTETLSATYASGGGGCAINWQMSTSKTGPFSDIPGEHAPTYAHSSALTTTTYFRVKYTSNFGCGDRYSNVDSIVVWPDVIAPVISASDNSTICIGATSPVLSIQTLPTGGDGAYVYTWQVKVGNSWVDIDPVVHTDSYQPGPLTETTRFRLKTESLCKIVLSNYVQVNVYEELVPGTIGSSLEICHGASTSLGFNTMPQNGGGNYQYQWQESDDNSVFSDIVGATSPTYTTPSLSSNKYYRVKVTSTCSSAFTNSVLITVRTPFTRGMITGVDTICFGATPGIVSLSTSFSGGEGSYLYQWMKSEDGAAFSPIVGQDATSFQPQNLISSTWYYLKATDVCGVENSDTVRIHVYPNLSGAHIASLTNSTICYDSVPNAVMMDQYAAGGNSRFTYQWQEKTSGSWMDLPGEVGVEYNPSNLRATTQYRVMATSDYGCGTVPSNVFTISVYPRIIAGLLTDDTLCYNAGKTIGFTSYPNGGGGTYSYQWQQSENGVDFSTVSAVSSIYSTGNLVSDKFYRVVVTSTKGCSMDTTNVMHMKVLPMFVPGVINSQDPICYHTRPDTITLSSNCSGDLQPYSYQWMESSDGTVFENKIGATDSVLRPEAITADKYYRLTFISPFGCAPVYSNSIMVHVYDTIQGATIATSEISPICYDSVPMDIHTLMIPSGADGLFTHQWQSNTGSGWNDIIGETSLLHQPANLQTTTSYRLISTSTYGCGSISSNTSTINVYDRIDAGSLTDTLICDNTSALLHFAAGGAPSGGGNQYQYQWLSSDNGINFTPVSGMLSSYSTGNLTDNKYYKAVVTSGLGCSRDTTDAVLVTVLEPFVAGSISGSDTICFDSVPRNRVISLTTPTTGGLPTYYYQWEQSNTGVGFTSTSSADNSTVFAPRSLNRSTYYRLKVEDSHNCGVRYTDTIYIHVWDSTRAAVVSLYDNDTICYDSIPLAVYASTLPMGGNGLFSYSWEEKDSVNGWHTVGSNSPSFQPSQLRMATQYRVKTTSLFGCGTMISNIDTVNVFKKIQSGAIYCDTNVICYDRPMHLGFEVMPSEGGGQYSYYWESSLDGINYTPISSSNVVDYNTSSNLLTTTYYRSVVTSTRGCSSDTTNEIMIRVHDRFVAGSIASNLDSICYGFQPGYTIDSVTNCVGGDTLYTYQWQMSTDGQNFIDAPHGTDGRFYQPDTIYETTYYRLIYMSDYNCGVDTSNVHTIKMNPLPPEHTISGPDLVCYSQFETYELPEYSDNYSYSWATTDGNGDVYSLSPVNDSIEIYWRNPSTIDTIIVEVTNNITGCVSWSYQIVGTRDAVAPDRTTVVRKPNSNILVCMEESPSLYYEWGYTVRATGEDVVIENSDRRYVILPHEFDSVSYLYWVNLSPNQDSPCYSRSYYDPANDTQIEEPSQSKVVVPVLTNGNVEVKITNEKLLPVFLEVYTSNGVLVDRVQLGDSPMITHNISNLKRGALYLVKTMVGEELFINKTVVR